MSGYGPHASGARAIEIEPVCILQTGLFCVMSSWNQIA